MTPAAGPAPRRVLFDPLLALSREAHAAGQHEVAYHALTAAMHAAEDARDRPALSVVRDEAQLQIDWIDRRAPGHRLSTASASRHNHPGVYASLVRQAAAHIVMLEHPAVADHRAAAPDDSMRADRDAPPV